MKDHVITYRHIGAILSLDIPNSDLETTLCDDEFDWDAIVIIGSRHLVLPAIYYRLKSKGLLHVLPEDLNTYLENLTAINRNRNRSLMRQITAISELLTNHNIKHVFLKGAALIASGHYEDIAERMVGDIDILVDRSQISTAFELLNNNGYDKTFGFAYETKDFRHLDRLISHKLLAAIELHSDLFEKPHRHLIDTNDVLNSKVDINKIAIPNDYYLALHNVLAWQLNDKGFFFKSIHFKHLYDSIVLSSHKNNRLIKHLLKFNFGRAYLELAKYYFPEFSIILSSRIMRIYRRNHLNYLNNLFFRNVLRPLKKSYLYTKHRTYLIVFNGSYRKHALKKIFIDEK